MTRNDTESTPTLEEIEERLRRLEAEAFKLRLMIEDKRLVAELVREATKRAGAASAPDEAAQHRPPRRRLELVRSGQDHLDE